MEAIGAASAIIGVAQFGIQFSQVLVTVIGDYKDAAKNINRLRDEIHLASICLKQLGDLANQSLLREYGLLEATNLRERCQAVFWEIRSTIQKGDNPLHPKEVTRDQIDVSNFASVRWALWTKNKLQGPREELDRLKDSMTLCFVSHMAILATSDLERAKYASQIPGIKRSLAWSEEGPDDDHFRKRLQAAGISDEKIAEILGEEVVSVERPPPPPPPPPLPPPIPQQPSIGQLAIPSQGNEKDPEQSTNQVVLRAWSIDPLARTAQVPVAQAWIQRFVEQNAMGDQNILHEQSRLHPWFKNELAEIHQSLANDETRSWSLVLLKPKYKHRFSRGAPQSVQVVMKGYPVPIKAAEEITTRIAQAADSETYTYMPVPETANEAVPYSMEIPISDTIQVDKSQSIPEDQETDEEIIAKQLALYQ